MIDRADALADEIAREARRGMAKFAAFHSPHEGWAVIVEELGELWDHVKANTGRSVEARQEAIQVAAMALRYAHDLCGSEEEVCSWCDWHGVCDPANCPRRAPDSSEGVLA